jgi:hypothetical protein
MAKGAKQQQLQSQTTTRAAPPSYAQPYVNDILNRASNLSYQPYQAYEGNRIVGFTDAEKTARAGVMGLQAPTQFNTATDMATKAGNYTPGQFDGGYDQAQFTGGNYATGQFDNTYKPTQFTGNDYATGQFGTNSFNDSGMASQYMSPYMQNVVDVQKRKAREDAQQSQLAGNLGASRLGTTGGSRQLLATLNRERNLATQMGDIQALGSQSAYEAGQKQYTSEADRRMDAQKQIEASRQYGFTQQQQQRESQDRANQFAATHGLDTQKQIEASRQYGATQRSQAEEAAAAENQFGAKYKMDAAKLGEDSRQFGSRQALDAANQLSQLGSAQQGSDINRYAAMAGVGETERDLRQKDLDMKYRDFTDQRDYEKNQLRDYSDIVGAQPEGNKTESFYGRPANQTGALIGAAGNIGSAYMMNKAGMDAPYAAGGEIYSYNSGGLVALADGGGVDAGKQQGLAAIAGGNDGSKYKLRNDPKELLYSTMGDPAKLQALTQQGVDPTAVGIAAMLAKRIYDTQSMAMAPQQTTVAGLLNPMPPQPQGQPQQPQGQMQGQPQGQPQDQQGLAGIAPQGQPMGDPMQPPMGDPSMGNPMQPPMDPMQAQGLEALAQQDQPMEEQPMEEPMMAANGGLLNINLPDDYYDEDSYSHGGIAHFSGKTSPEVKEPTLNELRALRDKALADNNTGLASNIQKKINSRGILSNIGEDIASVPVEAYDYSKYLVNKATTPNEGNTGLTTDIKLGLDYGIDTLLGRTGRSIDLQRPINSALDYITKTPEEVAYNKKLRDETSSEWAAKQGSSAANPTENIGFNKPINIKGLEETANLKPAPNVTGRSMMLPGKTAGTAEMPALPPSRNFRQEMADILNEKPAAATPATGYVPSEGVKKLSDLIDRYSKPSEIKEAYLASLNEQQPLKDTSKQDFWRTIGEMSSKLTEGSLEGKGLLEAAAGATSVLPGSVARSIENKQAREDAAKADRLTKLATMYGIDTSDRAAMMDLAMQQYEITSQEAADLYNRLQAEEAESYDRDRDYKQDRIKALELQMPEGGKDYAEVKRQYYDDLIKLKYSPQVAAKMVNDAFGQSGSEGKGFAPQTPDQQRAIDIATDIVMKRHVNTGDYDPFSPEIQDEIHKEANQSLKNAGLAPMVRLGEGSRNYNIYGELE